jgi:hypothetical protein
MAPFFRAQNARLALSRSARGGGEGATPPRCRLVPCAVAGAALCRPLQAISGHEVQVGVTSGASSAFPSRGSRVRPPSPAPGIARLAVWLACRPFAFRTAAFQMLQVRSRSPGNAFRSLSSHCHGRAPSARRARDAGPYARRIKQRACQATRVAGTTEFRALTRVRRRERCGIGWSPATSVSQRDVGGLVGWFARPPRADDHGASEMADKAGARPGGPGGETA